MAAFLYIVFRVAIAFLNVAEGSLRLDVHPPDIAVGLSNSLTLNCSFSYTGVSDFDSIVSLTVSKSGVGSNTQQQFTQLEALDVFTPGHVTGLSNDNDTVVFGLIDANGESYLGIQWNYPSFDRSGVYRCEARGVNSTGQAVNLLQDILVESHQPDLDEVIDTLNQLQGQLQSSADVTKQVTTDDLLALTRIQLITMNTLKSQLERQSDTDVANDAQLSRHDKLFTALLEDMFEKSAEYDGHMYLLSRQSWNNATTAQLMCEAHGAYLAEIENPDEHQFVKDFLNQFPEAEFVLIGGTNKANASDWVYTYSQTQLNYTDWFQNEPNTPDYHCLDMYKSVEWQMFDYSCLQQWGTDNFLCELDIL